MKTFLFLCLPLWPVLPYPLHVLHGILQLEKCLSQRFGLLSYDFMFKDYFTGHWLNISILLFSFILHLFI